jgi:CTP synthase
LGLMEDSNNSPRPPLWKCNNRPNLVGNYTSFHDSYISVIRSLEQSTMACQRKVNLVLVDASHLEEVTRQSSPETHQNAWHTVRAAEGILVPGGFGRRGTEGMIAAANWARENKIPYLGICLGMQIAVIEFARNMCNLPYAGSIELDAKKPEPVIKFMPEIDPTTLGGTMRLGTRATHLQPGSELSKLRPLYNTSPSSSPLLLPKSNGVPDGVPNGRPSGQSSSLTSKIH